MKLFLLIVLFFVAVFGYTLPIGVPNPSVTWTGVHPIDSIRPTLPNPWVSDQSGFYYVNNDSGSASDAGNGNYS